MEPVLTGSEFAEGLTDRRLACRELGHHWRPLTATWDAASRSFHRELRCPSCRTVRVQVLTESGHVVSNGYRYPDGYLAANVAPGFSRDVFRAEALRRAVHAPSVRKVI